MSKRTLITDITDKAEATFGRPINRANYDAWERHWVATADEWEKILRAEGLTQTADAVKAHADFSRRYMK